jgi:hypothetical protein
MFPEFINELLVTPRVFGEENPSLCTFAIVHRITQILVHNLLHVHNGVQHYKPLC